MATVQVCDQRPIPAHVAPELVRAIVSPKAPIPGSASRLHGESARYTPRSSIARASWVMPGCSQLRRCHLALTSKDLHHQGLDTVSPRSNNYFYMIPLEIDPRAR